MAVAFQPAARFLQLSFVALADLLEGVELGSLEGIPSPQLAALEVALLRRDPGSAAPERGRRSLR